MNIASPELEKCLQYSEMSTMANKHLNLVGPKLFLNSSVNRSLYLGWVFSILKLFQGMSLCEYSSLTVVMQTSKERFILFRLQPIYYLTPDKLRPYPYRINKQDRPLVSSQLNKTLFTSHFLLRMQVMPLWLMVV